MKMLKSVLCGVTACITSTVLVFANAGVASAADSSTIQSSPATSPSMSISSLPTTAYGYSLETIDDELTFLSGLPEEEQDRLIQEGLGVKPKEERIAPLIIVAAIGCALGVGGAIFNTNWSSASSVAWALAGVLVGCIPGTSQAKLVSVILKHKAVIAIALKAAGATAAANALLAGDSARP